MGNFPLFTGFIHHSSVWSSPNPGDQTRNEKKLIQQKLMAIVSLSRNLSSRCCWWWWLPLLFIVIAVVDVAVYGCFLTWWYPQIIHFNRVFHYFHHPFRGTPIFGNTPIVVVVCCCHFVLPAALLFLAKIDSLTVLAVCGVLLYTGRCHKN